MSAQPPPGSQSGSFLHPQVAGATANLSSLQPRPSISPAPPSASSPSPALPSQTGPSGDFQYSATTAEILNRIREKNTGQVIGTSASFQAKRAEVMQSYITSDKLPTPPPITNTGRRGRGGKAGTPSQLGADATASPAPGSSSAPARGSGRGRPRGRGRGGGRGGKRKRSESADESDVSPHDM
jgi:hypothetical protein